MRNSSPACRTVLLIAVVLAAAAPLKAQDAPTFKVDVSLVTLLVNVKDPRGAPVADLRSQDFHILDGGVEREIAVFERRTDRPLSVVLMLDASLSTAKELSFERESAKRFVSRLLDADSQSGDRAAVLQFSDYVDLLAGFTSDQRRLSRAFDRVRPESGTSLYDAVALASELLQSRQGRRVLVIITDGGDTTSRISFQEALETAHGADAVIYGIIVIPVQSDAGRNTGGEHALKTLAGHTGGEVFLQYGTEDLDAAFQEILRSLRTQYLIAYYPPPAPAGPERFRRTEVSVIGRPELRVLARSGYFLTDESPGPQSPPARITLRSPPAEDNAGQKTAEPAKERN